MTPFDAPQITADTWDAGGEPTRWVYLHAGEVFPTSRLRRADAPSPLPVRSYDGLLNAEIVSEGGRDLTFAQVLEAAALDGFLLVYHGAIAFETYPRMEPTDRHMIFSVTKAFVGTLLGMLEDEGMLDILASIDAYLPEYAGTAWAGTSLRDIADMASGMDGSEESAAAYMDPTDTHYRLEASLGFRSARAEMPDSVRAGETYEFLRTFKRVRPAGEMHVYTSANTVLLGHLLETVSGRRLSDLIAERLWAPIGAEQDALLIENRRGIPVAAGGLATTLRDLARFGLLFTPSGAARGMKPMPWMERMLREAREAADEGPEPMLPHGRYQWDVVTPAGALAKGGFGNQLLYIDTVRDVVIAYVGTNTSVDARPARLPLRALVDRLD